MNEPNESRVDPWAHKKFSPEATRKREERAAKKAALAKAPDPDISPETRAKIADWQRRGWCIDP